MHDLRVDRLHNQILPKMRLKKHIRRALVYILLMTTPGKYLNWGILQDLKEML